MTDQTRMQRHLRLQNQQAIERLNQITNNEIARFAEQVRVAFILRGVNPYQLNSLISLTT